VIVVFGLLMGALSIVLNVMGLNLGWVYLFMGIVIGSAVIPLWNLMTWKKASGKGAIIAAWSGLVLALISWIVTCSIQSGTITIENLGRNEPMLVGNLFAILSSGLIHAVYSIFIDGEEYDFSTLNDKILLVENDTSGLSADEQDPVALDKAYKWITRRGWLLTFILILLWPILSMPAGVFSRDYFAFWVLLSIVWGFTAATVVIFLPIAESIDEITIVLNGMWRMITCQGPAPPKIDDTSAGLKEVDA